MSQPVKILLALVVGVGLIVGALAAVTYTQPVALGRWLARRALMSSGLEEASVEGSRGGLAFFEGGAAVAETRAPGASTVVLLHGLGDHAGTWAQTVPVLLPHHHLLIPDLAGHGESGPESGDLALQDLVGGLEVLLDERAPGERVTLVGNSMGGWVALLYARRHPDRVERLVLVNSAGLRWELDVTFVPKDRDEARKLMLAVLGREDRVPPDFVLDDMVETIPQGPIPRLAQGIHDTDFLDGRLGEVPVPVDLLWGEGDGLFPLEYALRLESGLPAARLTTLPGCAHAPQVICPEAFGRRLAELLAEAPPAPVANPAPVSESG